MFCAGFCSARVSLPCTLRWLLREGSRRTGDVTYLVVVPELDRDVYIVLRRCVLHEGEDLRPVAAAHEGDGRRAVVAFVGAEGGRKERGEEAVAPAAAAGGLDRGGGVAGEEECCGFRMGWGCGEGERG